MKTFSRLFKYLDLYGVLQNFYIEKKIKLYTEFGGVLSMVTLLLSLVVFIFFSLDDFRRTDPIITTSSVPSEGYRKIKPAKEKIWVPWRIVDYESKQVNFSSILFPIIFYYIGERKFKGDSLNFKIQYLDYKLCNETEMRENIDPTYLNVPLNELYCIDMDYLDVGGSWISDFLNYVEKHPV